MPPHTFLFFVSSLPPLRMSNGIALKYPLMCSLSLWLTLYTWETQTDRHTDTNNITSGPTASTKRKYTLASKPSIQKPGGLEEK